MKRVFWICTSLALMASGARAETLNPAFLRDAGAGDNTFVLLTGMVGGVSAFSKLEAQLVARRYRVVVIDTYTLSLDSSDVTFTAMARRVDAIMNALRIGHANVVGHSHGAGVALRLAAYYPKRVSHLYFLNAGALESNNTPAIAKSLRIARIITHFPGGRRFVESRIADGVRENSVHVDWFDYNAQLRYTRPLIDQLSKVAAMTARFALAKEPESLTMVLARVHVPVTLILAGVATSGGAGVEELDAIRPLGDLLSAKVVDGVGHFMHEEAPADIVRALLEPDVHAAGQFCIMPVKTNLIVRC